VTGKKNAGIVTQNILALMPYIAYSIVLRLSFDWNSLECNYWTESDMDSWL